MEHRQSGQVTVTIMHIRRCLKRQQGPERRCMRMHDTFRQTCSAGGIHDVKQIII